MAKYPKALTLLIESLKHLPGVGFKTAERFAFHILSWSDGSRSTLAQNLYQLKEKIDFCPECHCLKEPGACFFCSPERDSHILCILSSAKDVYAFEETKSYKGLYHVLGSLLSPIHGKEIDPHHLEQLSERIKKWHIQEVVLALDFTLEGDATALFLKEFLAPFSLKVSRLAFGLPMGSPIEYVDSGTLQRALSGRQLF